MSSPRPTGTLLDRPWIEFVVVTMGGILTSTERLVSPKDEDKLLGGGTPSPSCRLIPGAGVRTS